jgi:glycosyltransferase involved in cell wall biosynthesis
MLSVCVPTWNGERYVSECISSILTQSYGDYELVIVDDHSTDGTPDKLQNIHDPRIKLIRNPVNLGLVGNWNRCVEAAMGDPILIFHQDDRMVPWALEAMVRALEAYPDSGFLFSNIDTIDKDGRRIGGHWNPEVLPGTDGKIAGRDLFRMLLQHGNFIPCPTVMVRRLCYEKLGLFDRRLKYTPDLEMWLRIALHYDAVYLAEPLISLRKHPGQESRLYIGSVEEIEEVWRAFHITLCRDNGVEANRKNDLSLAANHVIGWCAQRTKHFLRARDLKNAYKLIRLMINLCRQIFVMRFR